MLRPSPNHGTQRLPNDDDEFEIYNTISHYCLFLSFVHAQHLYKILNYSAARVASTRKSFVIIIILSTCIVFRYV